MKKTSVLPMIIFAVSLLTAIFVFTAVTAYAEDTYGICGVCRGDCKCGLCDPAGGNDRLGNGYLVCIFCDENGYRTCGTNHTGDGTPIGCDGSGYKNGQVCEICGGKGKYPCDVCFGTGVFECRCRQAGRPGECTACFGSGWRIVDDMGVGIDLGYPVYPGDNALIDYGVWGRHEYFRYDADRFGYNVSPAQAMAAVGATDVNEFARALRGEPVHGDGQTGQGGNDPGPQKADPAVLTVELRENVAPKNQIEVSFDTEYPTEVVVTTDAEIRDLYVVKLNYNDSVELSSYEKFRFIGGFAPETQLLIRYEQRDLYSEAGLLYTDADGKTKLFEFSISLKDGSPSLIEHKLETTGADEPKKFSLDLGTGSWDACGKNVKVWIDGHTASGVVGLDENTSIRLEDFDVSLMKVFVYGRDGFKAELVMSGNTFVLFRYEPADCVLPDELTLSVEAEEIGGKGGELPVPSDRNSDFEIPFLASEDGEVPAARAKIIVGRMTDGQQRNYAGLDDGELTDIISGINDSLSTAVPGDEAPFEREALEKIARERGIESFEDGRIYGIRFEDGPALPFPVEVTVKLEKGELEGGRDLYVYRLLPDGGYEPLGKAEYQTYGDGSVEKLSFMTDGFSYFFTSSVDLEEKSAEKTEETTSGEQQPRPNEKDGFPLIPVIAVSAAVVAAGAVTAVIIAKKKKKDK